MTRTLTLDPVTRIEGHARVLLEMTDAEEVKFAGLIVNELRGFERMMVGMEADRMPLIAARVCGVCPVSHALASVKALEAAFDLQVPPAGVLLRELLSAAQLVHSHALHLFAMAGPDLFFGLDAEPEKRSIVGLVEAMPDVAKKALRLRTLGSRMVESVGGRGVHPVTVVLGGISFELDEALRGALAKTAAEALELAKELTPVARDLVLKAMERYPALAQLEIPTHYLGMVKGGRTSHYDGALRLVDPKGATVLEFEGKDYAQHLVERGLDWTYLKPIYFRLGGEDVSYRVNSLGRLNVCDSMGTPLAQAELETFRAAYPRPCHNTVMHHWARMIEILHGCERMVEILADPKVLGQTRVEARMKEGRGVGVVEAPRGTLIHEYRVDAKGIVRAANLLVATQQNYPSINRSIEQAAQSYVAGKGEKALFNALEFAIRCYDPCLSCATHAVGRMPLEVEIRAPGAPARRLVRSGMKGAP